MSQVVVELDIPRSWRKFRLPPCAHSGRILSRAERREAEALVELVDMLLGQAHTARFWAYLRCAASVRVFVFTDSRARDGPRSFLRVS